MKAKTKTRKPRTKARERATKPVTRSELARLRGCAPSTVTRACAPGGPLVEAIVGDRGRIDLAHPATQKWLAGEDQAPAPEAPIEDETDAPTLGNAEAMLAMTYPEARRRYAVTVAEWLGWRRSIAESKRREVALEEKRGTLVDRGIVVWFVDALNGMTQRILRDMCRTTSGDLYILYARGEPREAAESALREALEQEFARTKEEILRALATAPNPEGTPA